MAPEADEAAARDEALAREARRIYLRYAEEFVERFDLCPWAAKARRDGHVEVRVVTAPGPAAFEGPALAQHRNAIRKNGWIDSR